MSMILILWMEIIYVLNKKLLIEVFSEIREIRASERKFYQSHAET